MKILSIVVLLLIVILTSSQRFHHEQKRQGGRGGGRQQKQKKTVDNKEYYKILEVEQNADEQQLKKSFKKLAIKYHPDKNKDDPEKAEEHFKKIVQAYEVLKDPEQRKIYDEYGEDGIKEGAGGRGGGHQGGFDDIFSQFFGQGGGGRRGGGGGFGHQQERHENFFDNTDVYELNIGSLSQFYRRRQVWIIFFYKDNQKQSKEKKDEIISVSEKFYGIFKVAAVNCREEEELCEAEFNVYDSPSLFVYSSNIKSEGNRFTQDFNSGKIAGFANTFMESFVRLVMENSYEEFISQDKDKHKILLFTQKKSTPPLYKALSKDFLGKLNCGEIRESETELIKKFQITQFPSLVAVTDAENYQVEAYEGSLKFDQVKNFLRKFANSKPKTASGGMLYAKEIDYALVQNTDNCGINDKNICIIVVADLKTDSNDQIKKLSNTLAQYYSDEKVRFYYVDQQKINVANVFGEEYKANLPLSFAIKGKRKKFLNYTKTQFNEQGAKDWIDSILGGGGDFISMKGTLDNNIIESHSDL